jgi:uroporphyrinogen-III decarboxylase
MSVKTENWHKLTPEEKFTERVKEWISPQDVKFDSLAVELAYKERVQMLVDAIQLRKPARVPVCPWNGFYTIVYGGITAEEAMNDYGKLGSACHKFYRDFVPDSFESSLVFGSAKVLHLLDYKVYDWAGRGLSATSPYQCVEAEYMKADEYDLLIADPSGYFMRYYLPRVCGALGVWKTLPPFTDLVELPLVGPSIISFGTPEAQRSLKNLLEAGQAALEWAEAFSSIDRGIVGSLGIPALIGGMTKAPFDIIGDTMRGTRAVMMDKFRQPGKLMEAAERLVPIAIELGVRTANDSRVPVVFIPLHKGADGFMSGKDFEKFYWPTLKAVIIGLINEGIVPCLFVEGAYNQRLGIIADPDIPKGMTVWMFDRTDIREVKKRVGGWACFGGNVPGSLLNAATPETVRAYVKELLEDVAQDGGFILSSGCVIDDARAENLHALIEAGKEYGAYP